MNLEKKKELFKAFLSNNQVLIVDKSSASRRRLTKTLVDLGAKRIQVHSVAHYSEAVAIVTEHKPQLVLSDYAINGGSGFDLFSEYRNVHKEEKKSALILITSNISQSAVAKAAEEDVDSFIIKPYTVKSLEKNLIDAVINKLYPSKYIQKIEEGKESMFAGNYDEAIEIFEKAISLNSLPSLAHFYHGQCKYFKHLKEDAEKDYGKGLEINKIHYKCQIGLYEMFKNDNRHKEAYDVVKNIAKYFPANPDRLKEVIRLCITTANYQDMDSYYDIFVNLDERTEEIINYICSGLYIYGKVSLLQYNKDKSREVFEKIGISCGGMPKFLKSMIFLLVEFDIFSDAKKLMSRFTLEDSHSADYAICNYLAYLDEMNNTEKISEGLDLFNKGFKDPLAAKYLIKALRDEGSDKKAQKYQDEAEFLWPDIFKSTPIAA